MSDKLFNEMFWLKWFMVILTTGLTLLCCSGAFDQAQDISSVGRGILLICGIISGAIATGYYREDV